MIKLIAMYKHPQDEAAFRSHYLDTHVPLVEKVPGLQKTVLNWVKDAPMGGSPEYFLITEMHYPDRATFDAAMASKENRACGKDLMSFAGGLVTLLVAEVD